MNLKIDLINFLEVKNIVFEVENIVCRLKSRLDVVEEINGLGGRDEGVI